MDATLGADHPNTLGIARGPEPVVVSKVAVFLAVVRRSGPHLIEASLIPTSLFYCCLVVAGLGAAYAVALLWLYAAVCARLVRHRPVPPLLVLGAIGITVRTTVSLASGSSFFYFAQPVASSIVMGCVFLISVLVGRPLVERLALEFWPLTREMRERPAVTRLLRGLTFLWAGVNLAIGATNLTLLLCLPLATYVAVRQMASWAIMGAGIALTIDRSVRTARREGYATRPTPRRLASAA
jgi:intracellular septation protein A